MSLPSRAESPEAERFGQRKMKVLPSKTQESQSRERMEVQPAPSDAELLARWRRGESEAFEKLYRQHAGRLYSLAYRMSGSATAAEDLVQETFLLAHRKLATFRGESALGTWLYRLGMNQCLDYLRSRQSRMAAATDPLDGVETAGPPGRQPSAGELIPSRLDLERAIARLPEGARSAFLLHDVEGFDHREVAEILGIAEGTSKSQVHKARLRLRAYLRGEVDPAAD